MVAVTGCETPLVIKGSFISHLFLPFSNVTRRIYISSFCSPVNLSAQLNQAVVARQIVSLRLSSEILRLRSV